MFTIKRNALVMLALMICAWPAFGGDSLLRPEHEAPRGYEGQVTNGVFAARVDKTLSVTWRGEPFIAGDAINYLDNLDGAESVTSSVVNGAAVLNVIQAKNDAVRFRRELALHPDGQLELTVKMQLVPYKNVPDKKSFSYSFKVPAKLLDGTKLKALTGRIYSPKIEENTFAAGRGADRALTKDSCRFAAFEGERVKLVFDGNPYGLMSFGDYCSYGEPVGSWNLKKEGEYVVFSFGYAANFYGGIFAWKLIVYEGTFDYDKKHFYREWSYHSATPASAQYVFGAIEATNGFQVVNDKVYSPDTGWGWEKADGLVVEPASSPDLDDNCVARQSPGGTNVFIADVTPGCYVVTINAGRTKSAVGPFDILLNGERKAVGVRVPAGDTKTLLQSVYVRAPQRQIRVEFQGNASWAVRSIVIHPVIYQNEDFTFDRGLWLVPGLYEPKIEVE